MRKLIDVVKRSLEELKTKIKLSKLDKVDIVELYGLQYHIYNQILETIEENHLEDIYLEEGSKVPSDWAVFEMYQDLIYDSENKNVSIQEKVEYSLQDFIDKYCIKKVEEKENV